MMKRPTTIRVKSLPAPVEWLLKSATGQQLEALNGIAESPNFKALVRLIGDFKHYNVYEVFNAKVQNDMELALLRAAKRGEVAGLDAFLYACQGALDEIKRRKEEKI